MAGREYSWGDSLAGPFDGEPPGPRGAGRTGNYRRRACSLARDRRCCPPERPCFQQPFHRWPDLTLTQPTRVPCTTAPPRLPVPSPPILNSDPVPPGPANDKTGGKRTDDFNHFKAVAEAIQGLTWVVYQPNIGMSMPPAHVAECWQARKKGCLTRVFPLKPSFPRSAPRGGGEAAEHSSGPAVPARLSNRPHAAHRRRQNSTRTRF